MALNIKNEHTCRLAAELAELTGETMTGAITAALQEKLERIRRERKTPEEVEAVVDRVMAIVRESGGPMGSSDHADLYDAWGLPA